jgi:3-phosphoshikimate 1-carboxyvinyltransferase
VRNLGLNPTRTGILEVMKSMGANLTWSVEQENPEPRGRVRVRSSSLKATKVEGDLIPRMVDELPLIALAATQASGTTVIAGAGELRSKESDRIAVLSRGLRTIGADIEEQPDGVIVRGPTKLKGGTVDSHGDHRMALTFAVAGLIAADPVIVKGWESSAVSYPSFERDLLSLARSELEIGTD